MHSSSSAICGSEQVIATFTANQQPPYWKPWRTGSDIEGEDADDNEKERNLYWAAPALCNLAEHLLDSGHWEGS